MFRRALNDSIFFTVSAATESSNLETSSMLPLLRNTHASSSPQYCHDEGEATATLVPFKISGSWRANSSFCSSGRHFGSRRSFSLLTDGKDKEELVDEPSPYFKGRTKNKDAGLFFDNEVCRMDAGPNVDGNDQGQQLRCSGCHRDKDPPHTHPKDVQDDGEVDNVDSQPPQSLSTTNYTGGDLLASHSCKKHINQRLLLRDQSNSDRVQGEALLRAWSSPKLCKSSKQQSDAGTRDGRTVMQQATHDAANTCMHLGTVSYPNAFIGKPGAIFSTSMHRTETMSSPNRTLSTRSTQSNECSGSAAKALTGSSPRNANKTISHEAARRSLTERQYTHTDHEKGDRTNRFLGAGDQHASTHAQAAQTKVNLEPIGAMLPASLQSPRSPLRWRSVISLRPLNPSHLHSKSQWEMRTSRSQSQKSRSSTIGSNSREGGRSLKTASIPAAARHKEGLLLQSRHKTSGVSTQKLARTRRACRALNPMQWLTHCRNEEQVLDMNANLGPKEISKL